MKNSKEQTNQQLEEYVSEEYVYDLNELSPREIMEDFFAQEETKVLKQEHEDGSVTFIYNPNDISPEEEMAMYEPYLEAME